jgi:hypothetical protein
MNAPSLDIIGDVHGEMPALEALGRELGYCIENGWTHPEGRTLLFLGDLVDRGSYSLEVAELAKRLIDDRRAFAVMGNHEYNLVAWYAQIPGYERPKRSNRATTEDVLRRRDRWRPVLELMRELPVGIEMADLRIIHACWHRASLDVVRDALEVRHVRSGSPVEAVSWLDQHVVLRSPFDVSSSLETTSLLHGLPGDTADFSADIPHEDLIKGYEITAREPFRDNDGKLRTRIRALWWTPEHAAEVLNDRTQVFGHYWNLPPLEGDLAPPHPSGHPKLRAWARDLAPRVPSTGRLPLDGTLACVDFQGVTNASDRACIGALRWPEREIVWATASKTAPDGEGD